MASSFSIVRFRKANGRIVAYRSPWIMEENPQATLDLVLAFLRK